MFRRSPRLEFVTASMAAMIAASTSACASSGTRATPTPSAHRTPAGASSVQVIGAPGVEVRWPVKTSVHVDLWLHAFALVSPDTTRITLFRRNYRDSLTVVKNRANVLTTLDANRDVLTKRLAASPTLNQAQFLAMQFPSWDALRTSCERFLQFQGESQRAPDRNTATEMSQLAPLFPTAADRDWLRLFLAGVQDEYARFYAAEFSRQLRERSATVTAVDSLWQQHYRSKFERFLTNTGQRQGDLLLSLPIGGEGREAIGADRQNVVVVPFPARPADALEAILVFAHEVTGSVVSTVIADNTSPAQQRTGEASRFVATGQVRAGLILLQKVAPELAEPYARFYLRQAGALVPATNATEVLVKEFSLPTAIVSALARQIDLVLAGI